jgi:serine/threonine-protein kinase
VRIGQSVSSIRYAAGEIASEDPPAGTHLRKGSVVLLQVSTGPPIRTVPSVQGLPVATAQGELSGRGFKTRVVERYSQTVKIGDVIKQRPPADARVGYGSTVTLVVSKGPEPVLVPQVIGRNVDEATAILQAAGFRVQRVDRFSDTVSRGLVVREHPSTGTAPKGSAVSIVVSRGPRAFPMPNVEGDARAGAEQELSSLGLDVHVVVIPSSSGNTVVGQSPSPGTTVHPGDSVTIYVA